MKFRVFISWMRTVSKGAAFLALLAASLGATSATASRIYLSGTGPSDAVAWEFRWEAEERDSGWTTIQVPSCWESEGFGAYDYGVLHRQRVAGERMPFADETGYYRTRFQGSPEWRDARVRLVFDGVMTDAEVRLNGRSVGPRHEGSFYRFSYDITSLLKPEAENLLEVTVHKVSRNPSVNDAERRGDFWIFGGIFRPVWLEVRPPDHVIRTAIDARADGAFTAEVFLSRPAPESGGVELTLLDGGGEPIVVETTIVPKGAERVRITEQANAPALWTAESPNLHTARFVYRTGTDTTAYIHTQRFGFRTIDVRPGDGIYLNGRRLLLKGVNRHCFRPATGRALDPADSYADARLIKGMNMNAVRTAHYPPDESFLEACDEIGLYVLDELTGWHDSYDTPTGARLIGEMVRRDVNHPSILAWNNGNERGWNPANDGEFHRWDPQQRPVLHPWDNFGGIETTHYPDYTEFAAHAAGPDIFMPTEFLHGLNQGGSAAGLHDYWQLVRGSRVAAGGFLWSLADEGVMRADHGGVIDTAGSLAPDGIVGPYHETNDGHHDAIREIWSPLQLTAHDLERGQFRLKNEYTFTDASTCALSWQLVRFPAPASGTISPTVIAAGTATAPALPPGHECDWNIELPPDATNADALFVTATAPGGRELFTWSWALRPDPGPAHPPVTESPRPVIRHEGESLAVSWDRWQFEFDWFDGQLLAMRRDGRDLGPGRGPQLSAWRHGEDDFLPIVTDASLKSPIAATLENGVVTVSARYDGPLQSATWHLDPAAGTLRLDYAFVLPVEADWLGLRFDHPAPETAVSTWSGRGPHMAWRNRLAGGRLGRWPGPESAGYWSDWHWLQLGAITVHNLSGVPFFGLGQPRIQVNTMPPTLPDAGFALLHTIPAVGTKFNRPDRLGPQSQPVRLKGPQTGSVIFVLPRD